MKSNYLINFLIGMISISLPVLADTVVNVDITTHGGSVEYTGGAAYAGEETEMYWNAVYANAGGDILTNALDSNGNITTVSFNITDTSNNAWSDTGINVSGGNLQEGFNLMNDWVYNNDFKKLTISGLRESSFYDLYLYGFGTGGGDSTVWSVNDISKYTEAPGNGDTLLTEGKHYVKFEGVDDIDGSIELNISNNGGNWAIAGIQVVEVPVVGDAHTPVPSGDNITPTEYTSLSWYSPLQDESGNSISEPNIVSVVKYDVVYYGVPTDEVMEYDPNFIDKTIVDNGILQSMDVALDFDMTYFWRVDTTVKWDSSEVTGSLISVVQGETWSFSTHESHVLPEIEMDNIVTTIELGGEFKAIVIENTHSIENVEFTLLTDDYLYPDGSSAELVSDVDDKYSPKAYLSTDNSGTYKVKLSVTDSFGGIAESVAEVVFYDNACDAKKASPSGWVANYYDVNGDCVVDILDFANIAIEWLNDNSMSVQENYSKDVVYFNIDAAIIKEAEDAYLPDDPEYVTQAPLELGSGNPQIMAEERFSGGLSIGYTDPGVFISYEIEVPEAGDYNLYLLAAYPSGSSTPSLAVGTKDDTVLYGQMELGQGYSWAEYTFHEGSISFATAGTKVIRLTWGGSGFNLDYFALVKK